MRDAQNLLGRFGVRKHFLLAAHQVHQLGQLQVQDSNQRVVCTVIVAAIIYSYYRKQI